MRYIGTDGRKNIVELEHDEQLTHAMFNEYLDCGWGITETLEFLKNQGRRHSDLFWKWLAN